MAPAAGALQRADSDQSLLSASSLDAKDRKLPRPSTLSVSFNLCCL